MFFLLVLLCQFDVGVKFPTRSLRARLPELPARDSEKLTSILGFDWWYVLVVIQGFQGFFQLPGMGFDEIIFRVGSPDQTVAYEASGSNGPVAINMYLGTVFYC
jgi:hypothetical protein